MFRKFEKFGPTFMKVQWCSGEDNCILIGWFRVQFLLETLLNIQMNKDLLEWEWTLGRMTLHTS
jgi:hypothetical protein